MSLRRLGVFCLHDISGAVDDYVVYFLHALQEVTDGLYIACNGSLTEKGRERLREFADDSRIYVRANEGYDMGAWRQVLTEHGAELAAYDELVLCNDSFYGPLYPLPDVFAAMEERPELDLWGITIHGQAEDAWGISPFGCIPEHVQSYFLVVRSSLLHHESFMAYWRTSSLADTFERAVLEHEVIMTKHFADLGFAYGALCDTRLLEEPYDVKQNHYMLSAMRLLREYRCPFIKRKLFTQDRNYFLNYNYGDEPRRALEYVREETGYDEGLILRHLLRTLNIGQIKQNLGLEYVLGGHGPVSLPAGRSAVIIAHLYYEDLFEECCACLCRAPEGVALVLTTGTEAKAELLKGIMHRHGREAQVRLVEPRGRDLSALLVGCRDILQRYDYLCFVHDKKSLRQGQEMVVGDAFFHMLWENLLAGPEYIARILDTFEREPLLGLLVPPVPYHGSYRPFGGKFWTICYKPALELADKLGINPGLLSEAWDPVAIGSAFWCRTAALQPVFAHPWEYEDFPAEPLPEDGSFSHALERIFPFAAQAAGYYTGWLMTEAFARQEIENLSFLSAQALEALNAPLLFRLRQKAREKLKQGVKRFVPSRWWYKLHVWKQRRG